MIESLMIYMLITVVTVGLAKLSVSKKFDKNTRRIFAIFTVLVPAFFAGIRYGIGTDYIVYEKVFNEVVNNAVITKRSEFGYVILNKVIAFFTSNFQVLLFVIAVIMIGCIYATLYRKKEKINVPFAMFCFMLLFYQMSFNLTRQLLAASILMYATKYLEEDKKLKYIAMNIIAISIHSVAIIGLPLTFLYNFLTEEKYSKRRYIFYAIALVIVIGYSFVLTPIFSKIPSLYYYMKYITFSYQGIGIGIFRYIILIFIPAFFLEKELKEHDDINLFFAISNIGFILWMNSYFSDYIAYRISYTFLINISLILGFYWKCLKYKNQLPLKILLLVTVLFFWYYDFFYLGVHGTVPYVSILS